MKWIELRRHAERERDSEELTPAGWTAAAALGRTLGGFDIVISSAQRRATGTAAAMGFPIAGTDLAWSSLWEGFDDQYPRLKTFGDFQAAFSGNENARLFGTRLMDAVRRLAEAIPDGGRALIVTHGGIPELTVAAARPEDLRLASEPVLKRLEGVVFEFDGNEVSRIRVFRNS